MDGESTPKGDTVEGGITDLQRSTLLRAAVANVGRDELKEALERTSHPEIQIPKVIGNAINALRKRRDPTDVVGRAPYRAALPYIAAAVADPCLSRTIEVLGDHSDDPNREQLDAALATVVTEFPVTTVAVMLASVADSDMPASDLCFELAAGEDRFGLTDWSEFEDRPSQASSAPTPAGGASPEQREARRLKKQRDAEERRRRQQVAREAGEQVRRARKRERALATDRTDRTDRAGHEGDRGRPVAPTAAPTAGSAPRLTRRAALTPLQEDEFDRGDPWVAGVVFAWVPFDPDPGHQDPAHPDVDGKVRRCVVIAGSPTHLLVRPGYSEGGVKSRDWKSVPLGHWRRSGFDQPTWIDIEVLAVPRDQVQAPIGWLSPEDWNALW
jgi:hypothetical protein